MKPTLRCLAVAFALCASGCVVAPDAAERGRRREADGYYVVEETGSRLKRKVPLGEMNAATLAGSSTVDKNGGANMRQLNSTLPTAIPGP